MRCAVLLVLAVSLAGQDQRFEAESRLVLVPVTVTDGKGLPVDGLDAADFVVLDNGRRQKVAGDGLATGVVPIALVVAVQSSSLSAAALEKVRKIGGMIQPLITGEHGCAAVLAFAQRVEWRQHCTSDSDAVAWAIGHLQPDEGKDACLLDAVREATKLLRGRNNVRRVLLLISESRDRGSESDLDNVVIAAQSAGVTVYAATYSAFLTGFTTKSSEVSTPRQPRGPKERDRPPVGPPGREEIALPPREQRVDILGGLGELRRLRKTNTTQVLTSETGGAILPFNRQGTLEGAIEKLGAELHTQYLLSFTPDAPSAGYHRLQVRVVREGEYRVRARPGYWSPWETQ
ncbi:MAG: VWA domain-containing protein [Bryobacteraceae bacterium]